MNLDIIKEREKYKIWHCCNFPSGPVVKTLCFHCRGRRFDLWLGTKILHATWCGQNKWIKKKKDLAFLSRCFQYCYLKQSLIILESIWRLQGNSFSKTHNGEDYHMLESKKVPQISKILTSVIFWKSKWKEFKDDKLS